MDNDAFITACRRLGLITRQEALEAGMTLGQLQRVLEERQWQRLQRAVYLAGSTPVTPAHHAAAAVRTIIDHVTQGHRRPDLLVAASHHTAAILFGLEPAVSDKRQHVTAPRELRLVRKRLRMHAHQLAPDDVVFVEGIPVTSLPRTLLDLLTSADRLTAVWALESALHRQLITLDSLNSRIERHWGRNGAPRSRTWVELADPDSESPLETAARLLFFDAGLLSRNKWQSQYPVYDSDGRVKYRLDLACAEARLAVELDGWKWHSGDAAVAYDRRRQHDLHGRGWRVLRFNWQDIHDRPAIVVDAVLQALNPAV